MAQNDYKINLGVKVKDNSKNETKKELDKIVKDLQESFKVELKLKTDALNKQIKDYKIDLPVVFDWEEWTNFNEYNLSFFDLNNIAEGFLKEIEKHGYKGMLYSSKNYLENIWFDMPYDVWIAQYYSEVTYNGTYKMWQICDNGLVDGIDTDVDINILY